LKLLKTSRHHRAIILVMIFTRCASCRLVLLYARCFGGSTGQPQRKACAVFRLSQQSWQRCDRSTPPRGYINITSFPTLPFHLIIVHTREVQTGSILYLASIYSQFSQSTCTSVDLQPSLDQTSSSSVCIPISFPLSLSID
jgi:hypothetical protein